MPLGLEVGELRDLVIPDTLAFVPERRATRKLAGVDSRRRFSGVEGDRSCLTPQGVPNPPAPTFLENEKFKKSRKTLSRSWVGSLIGGISIGTPPFARSAMNIAAHVGILNSMEVCDPER